VSIIFAYKQKLFKHFLLWSKNLSGYKMKTQTIIVHGLAKNTA
jgi:hypothetical protein